MDAVVNVTGFWVTPDSSVLSEALFAEVSTAFPRLQPAMLIKTRTNIRRRERYLPELFIIKPPKVPKIMPFT
jgi:hypothetical protein